MTCPDELTLSIHADGESSPDTARAIAAHLDTCTACHTLFAALETENAALVDVLGEPEVALAGDAPGLSLSSWVWGGVAICAATPLMLESLTRAMPSLPPALRWLGALGLGEGGFAVARRLVEMFVGAHDVLVPIAGFAGTLLVVLALLTVSSLRRLAPTAGGVTLALLIACAAAGTAEAAELRIEEGGSVRVAATETIDDTVFLSGELARVEGVVNGDVFAFAERVEISGTVNGTVYGAAKTFSVTGKVSGNVHAVGKDVVIASTIGGSAYLAGEHVTLDAKAVLGGGSAMAGASIQIKGRIGHGLLIAAENVDIEGSVARSVKGYAERLSVRKGASIGGDIVVTAPAKKHVRIDKGAAFGGKAKIKVEEKTKHDLLRGGFYLSLLARVLALLIIGFLLVTFFPSLVPRPPTSSGDILRSMGIGLVALFVTPVAMVLAALTVIGIPVAIILAALWAIAAYLSTLVVAFLIGARLSSSKGARGALATAVTLVVLMIVVELPLVGPGINFLVHLLGVGCLVVHLKRRYARRGPPPEGGDAGEPAPLPAS